MSYGQALDTILRGVARLPEPALPPTSHRLWWERGVLDGVETLKVFTQEVHRSLRRELERGGPAAALALLADLEPLFTTSGPRRPDGRLDEKWLPIENDDALTEFIKWLQEVIT